MRNNVGVATKVIIVLNLLAVSLSPVTAFAGAFGVGAYISSEPDSIKSSIADSLNSVGANVTRTEIAYSASPDWTPYDTGINLASDRGIENLILLTAGTELPSVDDWGNFVETVANRYNGKASAYEIFNEADNFVSANDYAPYLSRAYDKIKAVTSAKVIVAGLTARLEATSFWNGIYNAGAWDKFDALGLHPYRNSAPEIVEFNIGDFTNSINIAANVIRAKGGGKKIWITEFGIKTGTAGAENQANYIARAYIMAMSVAEVEKVIMYRFRDGDEWGMVNADLSHKTVYDRYNSVVRPLSDAGQAEKIYILDKKNIDNFDGVNGWKIDQSSNASLSLSGADGLYSGAMKYSYNFYSGEGYTVAEKETALDGSPVGLGIWAKGTTSGSILKLRVKDADNETFQFDMGKVTSSWNFLKFDFGLDVAKTSWGGNGSIDYPIRFESVVYDSQGNTSSGNLYLDELVAINGSADLYAYKFGSRLAYWKVSGSRETSVCGQNLNFTESPQITSVGECSSYTPSSSGSVTAAAEPASTTDQSSPTTTSSTTTRPATKENSRIEPDKTSAVADGKDNITFTISLKNSLNQVVKSDKLAIESTGSNNVFGAITADGDNYKATFNSTTAEEKTVKIKIGGLELGAIKVTFTAVPVVVEAPQVAPAPVDVILETSSAPSRPNWNLIISIVSASLILATTIIFLLLRRFPILKIKIRKMLSLLAKSLKQEEE
ncbi:MAG: invasin domain 3-containing protein [Patescibacteria group bacterium]|jgi:hypothetical protein